MFKAVDKNGQQIYLRDTVKYEAQVDDMGMLGEEEGQVILIPSENAVQVQSLAGGVPLIYASDKLEVTYSLVGRVAGLASNEELQELVNNAELRYSAAVAATKTKRGGGKAKAKAPAKANPFAKVAKKEEKPNPFVKKQGEML